MKIALTGSTGFIGGHVLRELSRQGVKPTLVLRPGRELDNGLDAFPHVSLDLANPPSDIYSRLGRPDVLVHLAWGGLPNYRQGDHLKSELPMQQRFLHELVLQGLPRLVVTGTCFEYGMQEGELTEDKQAKPDNPYGQAKDQLRQFLQGLQKQHKFKLAWARLFYMFGEDQSPRSLYPLLRQAALAGNERFPMSGGMQVRDFLPVDIVAKRLVQLALLNQDVGVVNVCSGEPVTVLDQVNQWIADHGWQITPQPGVFPYPDYEPMSFWGSARKIRSLIENPADG